MIENTGLTEQQQLQQDKLAKSTQITLYDILRLIFSNWYWFFLSIFVCGSLAMLYLHYTPSIYYRTATVLVKDSRKGGAAEITAFSDLMGSMGRSSVDNEVYIFESRHIMEKVVEKYDLATNYTIKEDIRTIDIYGREPILVKFLTAGDRDRGSFNYSMTSDGKVRLYNFITKMTFEDAITEHESLSITAMPGDTITTPLGDITLIATPYIERLGSREVTVVRMPHNEITEYYRRVMNSSIANKMSSIIILGMNDQVPKRAEDVINGVIHAYNSAAIDDKRTISDLTGDFIRERLKTLSEELNIADEQIANFKQENKIYSPDEEATMSASEIMRLNNEELSLEANLEMARYILDYVRNDNSGEGLIPASTISMSGVSTGLASQIEKYNDAILDYRRLKSEESGSNPVVLNLATMISSLRSSVITSLESHIDGLKLQISHLNRELNIASSRMESSPSKEKQLLSLARQQKVKEELYLYLLTKLEENALTSATAESTARVIDEAYGRDKPVSPNRKLILLIALVLGAAIPFAILYLNEFLNTKVRSRRDIEEMLSIPFLGDIPRFDGETDNGVVVKDDGRDPVSEAFRILRTNRSFMSVDKPLKVIMLTSSIPHSGKTFVSTNLSVSLANTGKKVLLMDLDLRRRTLSKQLGHRNDRRGFTSYMSDKITSIDGLISRSSLHDNLDIIYAGPQAPNPAEMLMSHRVDELFEELRSRYDYIIMDSTPALAVADAVITDRLVDLTVYVVRQGNLDRRQLPDIEQLYTNKKFHNMSVILNGVTHRKSTYGYGYGYGYGYSDSDEQTKWQRRWKKFRKLFKKKH